MRSGTSLPILSVVLPCDLLVESVAAQTPEVIYSEIASSPTSIVPGAQPTAARWLAIENFRLSHDGSQWTLKGRTDLGPAAESILILGSGTNGTTFAQEGQPFQGGPVGESYGSWGHPSPHPAAFDTAGNIGFSAIASAGLDTRLVVYDSALGVHTIVARQGDPVTGAVDTVGASGDETIGAGAYAISLLDNGSTSYVSQLGGLIPAVNGAYMRGHSVWRQEDVSPVTTLLFGATVFSDISPLSTGTTPDGLHWFINGMARDEPPTSRNILVVDGAVVLQGSVPIAGSSTVFAAVLETQMVSNGDWIARGLDPAGGHWVVYNGELVLRPEDPVGSDGIDYVLSTACNRVGDWVAACRTTGPAATNEVVLLNGHVVMRKGDPVDVDGDGLFDDDAFLGAGSPSLSTFNGIQLTDDLGLYFIAHLQDGAGNPLGDFVPSAFMRTQLTSLTFCDGRDGALASCPCAPGTPDTGCDLPQATGGVGLTIVRQEDTPQNRVTLAGAGYNTSGTPASITIRAAGLDPLSPVVFGDGLRCVGTPFVRLGAARAVNGASTHRVPHGTSAGSGTFYYQLWFRSTPASYCDPTAAFSLSSGVVVTWP